MASHRLIAFLYVLMRDELPVGKVHRIIRDHLASLGGVVVPEFSDENLERIATEIAQWLQGVEALEEGEA